ncbi:hypothetical protein [Bosea sp. (in: a-proteobacteria)]|uniref:hypothetical protein n=1 Tax=Bosea sp. (in: a-proteobacteria) TaxID=1871050 RepID=UPI00262EDCAD|nr:hypothetical protein [Bosea sp. (in: a-proteobacteria)]MCO5091987.1 hypothetical protein [Bosea sp. (in: a-proteobacteria)]
MASLAIVSPAPLHAVTALAFPSGRAPARHLQAMLLQSVRSETMAFVTAAGEVVMVVGLWPLAPLHEGERLLELWLLIEPPAVPHLPALRRLARLMLARIAQSGPVRIRALVREGHAPGARMCRLIGMSFVGAADGCECWEWSA